MEMAYSIAKERRDQGLLEMPLTWEKNESAREDWYYGFMLRHSKISLYICVAHNSN